MESLCLNAFFIPESSDGPFCGSPAQSIPQVNSVLTIRRKSSRNASIKVSTSMNAITVEQDVTRHLPEKSREQLVKRCINASTMLEAKRAHECVLTAALIPDIFVENTLINMYVRCGSIVDAAQVFHSMDERNVFSWTLFLSGLEKYGQPEEAVKLFQKMEQEGGIADNVILVTIIKACTSALSLEDGQGVYGFIVRRGMTPNSFVYNALVDMYAKCGSLSDAMHVFEQIEDKGVVSWNSIISGCILSGQYRLALSFFQVMKSEDVEPDDVTLTCVLKSCGSLNLVEEGIQIHVFILKLGCETSAFIGSTLVDFYSKSGQMNIASQVFNRMIEIDVVTWNTIIAGYASNGQGENALKALRGLLDEGFNPNEITILNILSALIEPWFLDDGRFVHSLAIEFGIELDALVGNSLIDMYGKCQSIDDAVIMFDKLSLKDTISWNTMITAYTEAGLCEQAINLFDAMQKECLSPNEASFVTGLHACSLGTTREAGMAMHAYAVYVGEESNTRVANTLIDMYSKCGCLEEAFYVFDTCQDRDVVSWNGMMTGYVQHGEGPIVLKLLAEMQLEGLKPNEISFIDGLSACANMESLNDAYLIHSDVVKSGLDLDIMVGTTVADMYAKCRSMQDAQDIFDKLPEKASAAWNSIIAGYGDNQGEEEALKLFHAMQLEEVMLDDFTFVGALNACASICALDEGKCIYSQYIKTGYDVNIFVGSALVTMYARCGHVDDARHVFDALTEIDLFLWTVMIAGYAQHGYHQEVFELWEKMQEQGVKPDGTVFVCVLSACSHLGLLDKGLELFSSMILDHSISPTMDHFACYIDLLGRAGCLSEAEHFLERLPLQHDASVWRALLGACKNHGNLEIAKLASNRLLDLEPGDHTAYVFLSDAYASSGDSHI
ncbi:hypothetical protein GOP47_0028682 [Adiantum capillus-veneris]|nr:hypothetical protein GOP47_0028682 [Adiantum capillus-veneris]